MRFLDDGVETCPVFYPIHTLPPHREPPQGPFPVAERVARRGFNLPMWAGLSAEDVESVASTLERALTLAPPAPAERPPTR